MKKIFGIIALVIFSFLLMACQDTQKVKTITFETNQGTPIDAQQFTDVYEVSKLKQFSTVKIGYIFDGWYLSIDLDENSKLKDTITTSVTLYAKWSAEQQTSYTITWQNEDGSVLKSEVLSAGTMPAYDGETPTKTESLLFKFTFSGFMPAVGLVVSNQVYVASFSQTSRYADKVFDGTELNAIFGFDIHSLLPVLTSNSYLVTDRSDVELLEVAVDFLDWERNEADAYSLLLDAALNYDETEEAWILGGYFVYIYENTETYPGYTVYGLGIYGAIEVEPEVRQPFDPAILNGIFGFDIYKSLPAFNTDDFELTDLTEETYKEVYIDIFDFLEIDANNYMDLLDSLLAYDEIEESWIVGDYFLYVYEDEETYPGKMVYGISIYSNKPSIETPIEGLYFGFNMQNTSTSLTTSYKDSVDKLLLFTESDGKVLIKASHLAIVPTPPTGLAKGIIMASDVKGNTGKQTNLEIDTLGNQISSINFEIEARDAFADKLKGAKVQVLVGTTWTDLAGGDFYSQLSTEKVSITVENINATQFRLLFTGTGSNSNGGQFMISAFNLYTGTSENTFESWSDMIIDLKTKFNDTALDIFLSELEGMSLITLKKIQNNEYAISGLFDYLDIQTRINNYLDSLILKGFVADSVLSAAKGKTVYVYAIDDDLAYALYISQNAGKVKIQIWAFDPVVEAITLDSLSKRQSINEYEAASFGKSGLPSKGTYNVLVIPVEIKGTPFPINYQSNLELLFNGTSLTTGWESVASYYHKSSYGELNITFDIAPKFTTLNTKSYYEGFGDEGDQHAISEALVGLDGSIDYSQYDSNNDGLIDSVMFVYSAEYNYDVDPWWAWVYSAQFGVAKDLSKLDGLGFEYYFWASYSFLLDELPGRTNLVVNAETYIHEMGHLMGMMDLYPYEEPYIYGPVGGFDMMDNNSGDHGPFNKLVYGWLQPLIAQTGSYQITLDSYALDDDGLNSVLLVPFDNGDFSDGNAFDEYLLIMFYTPKGLYEGHLGTPSVLKNAGIVIYHIDARLNSTSQFWDEYFLYNNEGASGFIVEILEADFNNSLPSKTDSGIKQSDILSSGSIDLSNYSWNQGGAINLSIEIAQTFTNHSTEAVLNINYYNYAN